MEKPQTLYFKVDAFTPETIPMARLADYLDRLAKLFGNRDSVHLKKLKSGSLVVEIDVEYTAAPKVNERLVSARAADVETKKVYAEIDDMLRQDNATAAIRRPRGGVVLPFPGRKAPKPQAIQTTQQGDVVGTVIRVGGRGDTLPIWLDDVSQGQINCHCRDRMLAREIAHHLFGAPIRAHGAGKWTRDPVAGWRLDEFEIRSFEVLSEQSLADTVEALRTIEGNGWRGDTDVATLLERIRKGGEK